MLSLGFLIILSCETAWRARSALRDARAEAAEELRTRVLERHLTEGVHQGRIAIEKVAETMAYNPARLFGLYPRKGAIQVGADADLVVVDMETEKVVGPDVTQSEFVSAFEGVGLRGWPTLTMRRGDVIYRDGKVLAEPGSGQVVEKPEPEKDKERNWHAA